ncbi:Sucrase/ferredoxin-like-domain-containing protein [Sphaerosporella brunnea]|uniref:Altered inheritance of mitochondria protein 32 n=1 Tax=Sphaerosporella brunnea TaxID=1250544 RepID=A0A5J5EKG1_9PEZI|nr:Sucrase/ferredoxin-like-domain-containing protein [Sphaerosporella brunnea]
MRPPPTTFLTRLTTASRRHYSPRAIAVPTSTAAASLPKLRLTDLPAPTSATCSCNPAEAAGEEIDRATPLAGTMPLHHSHVVIASGREDWSSRVELDAGVGEAVRKVKEACKRHGDPFAPVLVTAGSFPVGVGVGGGVGMAVFPSGLWVAGVQSGMVERVVRRWVLPSSASSSSSSTEELPLPEKIIGSTILICSHNSRDRRCGKYFPALKAEFLRVLDTLGVQDVRVEATSHLSGHKFAGNVVVYRDGWGVWYGRVGVEAVEGIVRETVVKGRVVRGLCRGVVGAELEEV